MGQEYRAPNQGPQGLSSRHREVLRPADLVTVGLRWTSTWCLVLRALPFPFLSVMSLSEAGDRPLSDDSAGRWGLSLAQH